MGYLVERANLIERLFRSLHLALVRVPGALAVATLVTCAVFATATGIVGAVVTLMGLLALPQMLRAGYSVQLSAGAITAGGCLGILIPPSVLLIVYGATAGVSVVKLYAGAFFPGLMLAGLYIVYVIIVAKIKPSPGAAAVAPRGVTCRCPSGWWRSARTANRRVVPALVSALKGRRNEGVPSGYLLRQLFIALLPGILFAVVALWSYDLATRPATQEDVSELQQMGQTGGTDSAGSDGGGLQEPPSEDSGGLSEPPNDSAGGLAEPPAEQRRRRRRAAGRRGRHGVRTGRRAERPGRRRGRGSCRRRARAGLPAYWISLAIAALAIVVFYALLSFTRLEVFKMLLSSFFPLLLLILAVLGSIVFGLATPTEAAAVGALGGFLLAAAYKQLNFGIVKESVFLTAKTSAMVCWLFVGSSIFSAAFALLGGQELVESWVLGMDLSKTQFLLLSQVIIFILGWPLEWTEIIVIFMPIFIPLLDNFGVDPLFFGLLVALNLQTAFLSPPVAMAAFYLKGVAPRHVTLNQIFAGMLPFMGIQVIAIFLLYMWPEIGLWLPSVLYK